MLKFKKPINCYVTDSGDTAVCDIVGISYIKNKIYFVDKENNFWETVTPTLSNSINYLDNNVENLKQVPDYYVARYEPNDTFTKDNITDFIGVEREGVRFILCERLSYIGWTNDLKALEQVKDIFKQTAWEGLLKFQKNKYTIYTFSSKENLNKWTWAQWAQRVMFKFKKPINCYCSSDLEKWEAVIVGIAYYKEKIVFIDDHDLSWETAFPVNCNEVIDMQINYFEE